MNKLQIFENSEFGEVRVIANGNDETMFCLADVCKALKLSNPTMVRERLSPKGISLIDTLTAGGTQQMAYVNESNLYRCIFQCRKKKAATRFQDWVFEEVLPSIRKDGGYMLTNHDETPEELMARALAVAQATLARREERLRLLEKENVELTNKITEVSPKLTYLDRILSSTNPMFVTQIAKDYGMSPQEFNIRLEMLGVQYKVNKQWVLRAKYQNEGYVDSVTGLIEATNETWVSTVWTQKGRFFLYNLLKEHGVLAVMDRYAGYQLPPIDSKQIHRKRGRRKNNYR